MDCEDEEQHMNGETSNKNADNEDDIVIELDETNSAIPSNGSRKI
jgi:hypothetical protein